RNRATGPHGDYPAVGDQARRARVERAQLRRPGIRRHRRHHPGEAGEPAGHGTSRGEQGDQGARAAVRHRLPKVAPVPFIELLRGNALFLLLEVGEHAGSDEEDGEEQPPQPTAETKGQDADDQRAHHARRGEGAAPVANSADQDAEDDSGNKLNDHGWYFFYWLHPCRRVLTSVRRGGRAEPPRRRLAATPRSPKSGR